MYQTTSKVLIKVFLLSCSMLFSLFCFSQGLSIERSVLGSSGSSEENNQSTGFKIEWSLGELVTTEISSNDLIITQGFHQAYFDFAVNTREPAQTLEYFTIYPNPVGEVLFISPENDFSGEVQISIFDVSGKKVLERKNWMHQGEQISIDVHNLSSGLYLISLLPANIEKSLQQFKLIKTN